MKKSLKRFVVLRNGRVIRVVTHVNLNNYPPGTEVKDAIVTYETD